MTSTASRWQGFGTTIFAEMSALAERTGAINLGQGFPDTDGPAEVLEAARRGDPRRAQPVPAAGRACPALREAIAAHQRRFYGLEVDPDDRGAGHRRRHRGDRRRAARALRAGRRGGRASSRTTTPTRPAIALAGARAPAGDAARRRDCAARPRRAARRRSRRAHAVLLLNSPHNPTGKVFSRAELELIAAACVEHDLVAVTDEVYEHLVFDGASTCRSRRCPGMGERTLTISSAARRSRAPAGRSAGLRARRAGRRRAHGQAVPHLRRRRAVPAAVAAGARRSATTSTRRSRATLQRQARPLVRGPRGGRASRCSAPPGTYFVTADIAPLGDGDVAFCRELPERAGVVAIPTSVFYDDADAGRTLVRFAFCKRAEVLDEAARRLAAAAR